ncbi:hypothetical protein MINTM016_31500 [Mycobacterium intracellulare]|nr:hypothetical protein MINTM016_31500 [Mycobacterium intracellulare]
MRHVAGRVEPFHQHLERHILVFVGRQAAPAHPAQQFGDGGVATEVDPQNQGVDEEPDHLIQGGVAPPGDREPHGHIGTGAQRGQQHRQGRLDDHEARCVVCPRQLGDLVLQGGRPVHVHAGPAMVGHQRVGPIRGQLNVFRQPGQGALPIVQLRRDGAVGVVEVAESAPLPQGVVDVLHRQRRPIRRPPAAAGRVGLPQIAHQRGHRPSVGGDVVDDRHQHVFVLAGVE